MAYRVVKRISGREYQYTVTSYRDPRTRAVRQRWEYNGPLTKRPPTLRRNDTAATILGAILTLLDKRDLHFLTVEVITRAAGVSRNTFYRHFASKTVAIRTAVESVLGELRRSGDFLALEQPIASLQEERARVAAWMTFILHHSVRSPGVQRAMTSSRELQAIRQRYSQDNHAAVHNLLVRYITRLRAALIAGHATADADSIADAVQCILSGVFKRVVYDGVRQSEATLLGAGIAMVQAYIFD